MAAQKPKIITIGSVTQDVFLTGKAFQAVKEFDGNYVEEFKLGAKIEVDKVIFSTGGGASNAAVTFARQNIPVGFLGSIADDPAGSAILKMFSEERIDASRIAYDHEFGTDYSTIMLTPTGERTVLIYRGASHNLLLNDYDWESLTTEWLYITSLAGNMDFLEAVLEVANRKGIKVAIDPGSRELEQRERFRLLLPMITVLKANREELARISGNTEPVDILRDLAQSCPYVIVTDAAEGSWGTDRRKIYRAGTYEDVVVKDRTGAGDAFGSGVVAMLAQGRSLRDGLVFGSANSTSVVMSIGAKTGILRVGTQLHDMPISEEEL